MSTSLLYHAFGVRGHSHVSAKWNEGATFFTVAPDPAALRCADCGSARVTRAGSVARTFRSLPIGARRTFIHLAVPRLLCADCGKTRQAKVGFADERARHTKPFERYVLCLARLMTIQDVARHLDVGWDLVKDILKRNLQARFKRIPLRHLKRLAIDEIHIGHGHRYLTIVLDLDGGAVVHIGEGKGVESLDKFWRRLRASRAKIEAVASDMAPAYISAVAEHLPGAVHVIDRFHVVKLMNDTISAIRREVQAAAQTAGQRKVPRGTRWLLLKRPDHLDEKPPPKGKPTERERLDEALRLNAPLATAYYLKEDLRQFWEQDGVRAAEAFLDQWCARAHASGVKGLMKFAKTMQLHRARLLNWHRHPISTGPLEGTNNKIRTLQRQAYGYRDQEFFRLRIFAIHEATYALVG